MCASFTAAATLDVSVDDSQLRQVRRDIERGIGDVTVQVEGEGGGGGRRGGTGGFAVQTELMRRTLTAQQASADFDEERNRILEDIHDTLKTGVSGGGGVVGGGGGGDGDTTIFPVGGGGGAGNLLRRGIGAAAGFTLFGAAGFSAGRNRIQQPGRFGTSEQAREELGPVMGLLNDTFGLRLGERLSGERTMDVGAPQWVTDLFNWQPPELPTRPTGPNREGGDQRLETIAQRQRNRQPPGDAVSTEGGDVRLSTIAANQPRVNIEVNAQATVQDIQRALEGAGIQRQIVNAMSDQVSGFNRDSPRTFQP